MKVICHGGYCCGMTHIQGFPSSLAQPMPATIKKPANEFYKWKKENPSYYWMMQYERPQETAEERLRWLVSQGLRVLTDRSSGIVEAVLTSYQGRGVAETWRPLMTELGFKEVNSHQNSNSGRTLHVFHLNTGIEND